jgi:hypothetical protein
MQTFIEPLALVDNPRYAAQRRRALDGLQESMLDAPIVDIVSGLNRLSCCFTLQSCHGHFVFPGQPDPHNVEPLPTDEVRAAIEYRIAYLALCVEYGGPGVALLRALRGITSLNPEFIQFGCATWFWERQVNSFVLQVEPWRCRFQDTATLDYPEALVVQAVREVFFNRLRTVVVDFERRVA